MLRCAPWQPWIRAATTKLPPAGHPHLARAATGPLSNHSRSLSHLLVGGSTAATRECRWPGSGKAVDPQSMLLSHRLDTRRRLSVMSMAHGVMASAPVQYTADALCYVNEATGLPWWATIALSTVLARGLITLPISIFRERNVAKVQKVIPEVSEYEFKLLKVAEQLAKEKNWDRKELAAFVMGHMARHSREVYIRDNCHPLKPVFPAVAQIGLWVSLSLALRSMCGFTQFPDLASRAVGDMGGFLWIPDLLHPDPTGLLPAILFALNVANIELHSLRLDRKFPSILKVFLYMGYAFSVLMVPVSLVMPSAMSVYWASSSVTALAVNLLLMLPPIRRALRIPPSPLESPRPFSDIRKTAVVRYRIKSIREKFKRIYRSLF